MTILAIETATTACAIGLRHGDRDRVIVLDRERRHTEALAEGIAAALAESGCAVASVERIVVDRGPGLFTGLRVGLAVGQAMAHALGIPLIGVTSLEVLAEAARADGHRGLIVALVDARRGELFAQRFEITEVARPLEPPAVLTPEAVAEALRRAPAAITGDGAARYAAQLDRVARERIATEIPPPDAALRLGATREPAPVVPLYLRAPDAVANFTTRERPAWP